MAGVFPEGSTIGGVNVGGKTVEEARAILHEKVEKWKNDGSFVIVTANGKIMLSYEYVNIDVSKSIAEMADKVERPWYAFFKNRRNTICLYKWK